MRTIALYPHLIAPIGPEGVTNKQWRAIWLIQNVANSLMVMFNGRDASTYCGTVQRLFMNHYQLVNSEGETLLLYIVNSPSLEDAKRMARQAEVPNVKLLPIKFSIEIPAMFQNCLMDASTITSFAGEGWSVK